MATNRYICKACGRKKYEYDLQRIGTAYNCGNVWLCKNWQKYYVDCDKEKAKKVMEEFQAKLNYLKENYKKAFK